MKTSLLACLFVATVLAGCGGGGDNAGVCSGSIEYCTEFAANSGAGGTTADGSATSVGAYSKSGTGDAVFDIPSNVTKIRIQAAAIGGGTNFIVRIDGLLIVNTVIGPTAVPTDYSGDHLIGSGGTVQITFSSGATWKFTEIP